MSNKKSLLEEIDRLVPERDKHNVIESRTDHVINSAINVMEDIENKFTQEEADELIKRFLLSVRNKDPKKFQNKIRKLKESKEKNKGKNNDKD